MLRLVALLTLFVLSSSLTTDKIQILKPRGSAGKIPHKSEHTLSNYEYATYVYLGTSMAEFYMTVGILSQEIWVQGTNCKGCKSVYSTYDPKNSTKSLDLNKTKTYSNPDKNFELRGSMFRDEMNLSGVMIDLEFAVADKFVDPHNLIQDGILGLGNDNSSIIYSMYSSGHISAPVYSLFNVPDDSAYLILDTLNFTDLDVELNDTLTISLSQDLTGEFSFNNKTYPSYPVNISSINSYFSGPYEVMQEIYTDLINDFGCYYMEELLACECDTEFQDMSITIQGVTLTIPSSTYLMTVQNACILYAQVGTDKWVLGEPLLKNYLVSVDLIEREMHFYTVTPIEHYEPSAFETYEGWIVVGAAVFGSLFIYVAAAGIYQVIKRRMETEEQVPLLDAVPEKTRTRPI